jgi:hypothetical protein
VLVVGEVLGAFEQRPAGALELPGGGRVGVLTQVVPVDAADDVDSREAIAATWNGSQQITAWGARSAVTFG